MTGHPRVLVAPDKFKGTLSADEAAAAMTAGIRAACPEARVSSVPVADGGEGTVEAMLAAGGTVHEVKVRGPLGEATTARLAILGGTAFVESAQACGLQLIEPDANTAVSAHSFGVGELIRAALDLGCTEIIVGLGGVACTDGGAGMAASLGALLIDEHRMPTPLGGAGLQHLARLDTTGLDRRLRHVRVVAACDVTSPLTGSRGAAAVFGPQKGAGRRQVEELDAALERYSWIVSQDVGVGIADTPGGGAAGGLAAGMIAFLGAEISSGCDLILSLLGFPACLAEADVVVTGEGKLDGQSLTGKAPVGVATLAREHGVPTLALAGVIESAAEPGLRDVFARYGAMVDVAGAERALGQPALSLRDLCEAVFADWLNTSSGARNEHRPGFYTGRSR